jgi:hypothetical protein
LSVGIRENFVYLLETARGGLELSARRPLRGKKISRLLLEGVRIIALEVQIARQSFRGARGGENRSVLARVRVDEKLSSRASGSSVCSIA